MEIASSFVYKILGVLLTLVFAFVVVSIMLTEEKASKDIMSTKIIAEDNLPTKTMSYIDLSSWMYRNINDYSEWEVDDKGTGETYSFNNIALKGSKTIVIDSIDYENNIVTIRSK